LRNPQQDSAIRLGLNQPTEFLEKLEVLATNRLDDRFDASPAITGNKLILRGQEHLYRIASK
jgi:hypothetical protein